MGSKGVVARDEQGPATGALRAAWHSDVGMVRLRNEDACHVDPGGRFFILADGVGGHLDGDIASATAVDVVRTLLEAAADDLDGVELAPSPVGRRYVRDLLAHAVRRANDVVRARAKSGQGADGMATTLEVVVVLGRELFVAHVGDSRTYLVREGSALPLTTDHTAAEEMRANGMMSDEDSATSPLRSMLTNSIGFRHDLTIEHHHLALEDGDHVLVCSDGLYEYLGPSELGVTIEDHGAQAALAILVGTACSRGGHDNITGIVIELPAASIALGDALDDDSLSAFVEAAFADAG
jgi:serine/threonine protein phosphatase PrpC